LGHDLGEQWTATKVSCWVPRQNGKGGIIEALELAWLFLFEEDLVIHSAHQHRTSQKAYERLERLIRRTPDMHRRIKQYRQANGEQQIELRDGRLLQYVTRSRTAVRGFSASKVVLDEAQVLTGEQMAAILPTVSAMENSQVWFFGTPPTDPAAWCYGLKDDGEAGSARLAHFDWGLDIDLADPASPAVVYDRDSWYAANPAMGRREDGGRIAEETVEDEARPSGLGVEFPYERLGVWRPRLTAGSGVLDPKLWVEQADPTVRPKDVAFAVDINPARTHAAIVAVGARPEGAALQAAVIAYAPGTDWVASRLAQLKADWNPVAIGLDVKGPGGSLLLDLEQVGIRPPEDADEPARGDLAVPTASQTAAAFGLFVDAVRQRALFHSDDAVLNQALNGAKTRALAGGSAWDRKGGTDICPLVAATTAHWAFLTRKHLLVDRAYDPLANIW
jgi:hypothetical protein